MGRNYLLKELQELASMGWQEPEEYDHNCMLVEFDQGGRNVRLDKQKCMTMGVFSQNHRRCNALMRTPGDRYACCWSDS